MKTNNFFSAFFATVLTSGLFAQGISIQSEVTDPSCYGEFNGSISVNASGGTAPYYYYWSTRDNSPLVSGLGDGEYILIVADAAGNSVSETYTLTQPQPVLIEGTVTNVTSFGGHNGTIHLNVSGLTSSYFVQWSSNNGSWVQNGSLNQTGLSAGIYTVTIVTESGCVNTKTFVVSQTLPKLINPELRSK
jgi:hypothetical protein